MKSLRLILALVVLLAPSAAVRAQMSVGAPATPATPTPQPTPAVPTSVSPLPPSANESAVADDVTTPREEEQPSALHQGVLVETLEGTVVREQAVDQAFNPASAMKLATALDALRTFGPRHRFATTFWINGTFDKATGAVTGDLVVSGRDPSFHDEHAVAVARELNQLGIKSVTGDLIVAPKFSMNFSPSSLRSGERRIDSDGARQLLP